MQQEFDFYIKLVLGAKGSPLNHAYGPGTAQLLRGVKEFHSLNKAAKEMGMAYSKAWKSILNTEEQLGFSLTERKRPDGSVLTREGEAMLKMFDEMNDAAKQAVLEVGLRSPELLFKSQKP